MKLRRYQFLFRYLKEYGLNCFIALLLSRLFHYNENGSSLSWWVLQYKHKVVLSYLLKHYYSEDKGKKDPHKIAEIYKDCIWTAWLQGEQNAPEMIQLALASIRKNANNHQMIVLTEKNIDNYIEVPLVIKEKHKKGIIGYAHYADIVRMMILAKYGGIWLDATMLLVTPISEEAFLSPFYSVGFKTSKSRFIARSKWNVRVIGGNNRSEFLSHISAMLTAYWVEHDICIDYFVFDYLIAVLYEKDESFKYIVDRLPKMNYYSRVLREIINEPFHKEKIDKLFASGLMFYLTYKYDYQKKTPDGNETNYGYVYSKFLS